MRLIFAGTPEFASEALAALLASGHEIVLVLTRADKPSGRGQKLQASPVKQLALAHGLTVFQPTSLRDPAARQVIADAAAQVMIVAAYGLILPPEVLALPAAGCLNIHASLLPRWRGAAPIQRAIEAGDTQTGITIMQMDAGLDTGPMLLAQALPIAPDENAAQLHDRLAALGARLVVEALDRLATGGLVPVVQPAEGVTYASKILKSEAMLDWRTGAARLADRIRAFDPFPGCAGLLQLTEAAPETLKIWRARPLPAEQPPASLSPGQLVAMGPHRLCVVCGDGLLEILEVQRAGGRRMAVAQWRQATELPAGARFALA